MAESRAERRKKAREAERARSDEIEAVLDKPKPNAFEAPATGRITDSNVTPPRPAIEADDD
jgi:hypothetical protein